MQHRPELATSGSVRIAFFEQAQMPPGHLLSPASQPASQPATGASRQIACDQCAGPRSSMLKMRGCAFDWFHMGRLRQRGVNFPLKFADGLHRDLKDCLADDQFNGASKCRGEVALSSAAVDCDTSVCSTIFAGLKPWYHRVLRVELPPLRVMMRSPEVETLGKARL